MAGRGRYDAGVVFKRGDKAALALLRQTDDGSETEGEHGVSVGGEVRRRSCNGADGATRRGAE